MQKNNYQLLIDKLDQFIRKYYKNQLIKGGIYAFSAFLVFFLFITLLEYFGHFNTTVRTILFYLFVTTNMMILWRWVLIPLFHLKNYGKIISHQQAAAIIGKHFSEVKDKLLNILNLKNAGGQSGISAELVEAGINQKIEELSPIPFSAAINLNENKKYAKFAAIPFFLFLGILFSAPGIIKDSAKRLIKHNTYYEKQAPFSFHILNAELRAAQQEDFMIELQMDGNEIPHQVMIEFDGNQYQMQKIGNVKFTYLFKNIQKSTPFEFTAEGFHSREYELTALPKPLVVQFKTFVHYPPYLHKKDEELKNTGDLIIPAGTRLQWEIYTRNTRDLKIRFQDTLLKAGLKEENIFTFSKRFLQGNTYAISSSNEYLKSSDSIKYTINVVPDMLPSIQVDQSKDSLSTRRFFFKGTIKDDYGFNKLTFNYRNLHASDSSKTSDKMVSENISINRNNTQEQFFFYKDFADLKVTAGDEIEYYFEVWDNDGVSGSKAARSQSFVFKAPSLKEIAENTNRKNEDIKNDLKESIKEAKQLQKDLADMNKRLLEKKNPDWQDKKKLEELVSRQKELQKKINNIKNENQQKMAMEADFKEVNKDLLDKQKQLNELMDKIMNDELKKLMEEMEKLMSAVDKQKLQETVEQMKLSNKDIEKELDRSLEIFKQLEIEQKIQESIEKLDDFAKKQEQLANETQESKKADNTELKQKQEELNKEFKDIAKQMDELEQKDKKLEFPKNFDNPEEEKKEIEKDLKESKDQLNDNKNKKAATAQKKAAEKAEKLAAQMKEKQQQGEMEEKEDESNSLRSLLENLVKLSFSQEELMNELKNTDVNNPKYLSIGQKQRKLKDDARMIEDSLFAISKRMSEIQSSVNKEISAINMNMEKSLDQLEDRQTSGARSRQQFVMTSVNNLSLLLSEVLNALQNQMNQKQGMGACKKPGGKPGGKPSSSIAQLKKLQEQLNKRLQDMKDGKMPGQKPGSKEGGMSQELARMAAQQQAIRNELQKINQQNNKDGKGSLGNLDGLAKQMDKTETDLVNKIITQETINRQQEILTRLLESEKAEKERDQDNKRESNEGKNIANRNPNEFEEYKKLKLKEIELLKTIPPALSPFYKKKINEYFQSIETP